MGHHFRVFWADGLVLPLSHLALYRKSLDKAGANMEVAKYTERLVPSTRFVAVDGVAPMVAEYGTFVAPSASVIGDVTIGRNSR